MSRRYTLCMFLLSALLVLPGIVHAQDLKVKAFFDTTNLKIGDQTMLHLQVEVPAETKLSWPVFSDSITGKVEIIRVFPADSARKEGKIEISQKILVTSFDSGYHAIPPIPFVYAKGQQSDTVYTAAIGLNVTTVPVDSLKDILDIKPPLKPPFSILDYWPYFAGLAAAILIGFILFFLIKRKKKGYLFIPPKPEDPAYVVALRELDALRSEKLWQNNKVKEYYTKLTDVIRAYIEKQFGINAMEMTSEEILQELRNVNPDEEDNVKLLNRMFSTSDLVKFAKAQPLPDENETNLLDAYQFVNNTKPSPQTSEAIRENTNIEEADK